MPPDEVGNAGLRTSVHARVSHTRLLGLAAHPNVRKRQRNVVGASPRWPVVVVVEHLEYMERSDSNRLLMTRP